MRYLTAKDQLKTLQPALPNRNMTAYPSPDPPGHASPKPPASTHHHSTCPQQHTAPQHT